MNTGESVVTLLRLVKRLSAKVRELKNELAESDTDMLTTKVTSLIAQNAKLKEDIARLELSNSTLSVELEKRNARILKLQQG